MGRLRRQADQLRGQGLPLVGVAKLMGLTVEKVEELLQSPRFQRLAGRESSRWPARETEGRYRAGAQAPCRPVCSALSPVLCARSAPCRSVLLDAAPRRLLR
jgi:hypothetical protein